jgi:hypothetical protein
MTKDCGNDLQSYIYYIKSRRDKLWFLGDEISEPELIHIFLRGLCTVFQPLQIQFALPGMTPDTLDKVIAVARKFSTTPVVAAELAKLKTPNANVMIASNPPRTNTNRPNEKQFCRNFTQFGTCKYGGTSMPWAIPQKKMIEHASHATKRGISPVTAPLKRKDLKTHQILSKLPWYLTMKMTIWRPACKMHRWHLP